MNEIFQNMKTISSFLFYGRVPKGDDEDSSTDAEESQKDDGKPKAKDKENASSKASQLYRRGTCLQKGEEVNLAISLLRMNLYFSSVSITDR